MVGSEYIIGYLPPFTNDQVIINEDQSIKDIVKEVIDAHYFFANDYDYIYEFFLGGDIKEIAKRLFDFCKKNITYRVEGENSQTTKSPAAILSLGFGDCKHYSSFIGGVLDAINRNTDEKIKWSYRFASYSYFDKEPAHVFIVIWNRGVEIWVDPVLCCFDIREPKPTFFIDKFIKTNTMLKRVAGINQDSALTDVSLENSLRELAYYGIVAPDGKVNRNVYAKIVKQLPETDAKQLTASYNFVMNYNSGKVGGWVGDFFGALSNIFSGGSSSSSTTAAQQQQLLLLQQQQAAAAAKQQQNMMLLVVAGVGVVLFFTLKKK